MPSSRSRDPLRPRRDTDVAADTGATRSLHEDVLDNIDLDIAVLDPECRFEYLNPASVPDPEVRAWLIGRSNRDYCERRGKPVDLAVRREEAIRIAVAEGRKHEEMEQIISADGRVHYILRTHLPLLDEEGRVRRILGYGVDRTAEVERARKLELAEEERQLARRLDATGRLAGGLAHEFNNLLTAIRVQTELLLEDAETEQRPGREGFQEVLDATDRAARLVDHLLTFSRSNRNERRATDIGSLVEGLLPALRARLGEGMELDAGGPPHVIVHVDPDQIAEAVHRLVQNAVDAMPEGGTVSVVWSRDGDSAVVTVRDTGHGMNEATSSRAFEPFFTSRRDTDHSGLGLSVVHGVVTGAGGEVLSTTREGEGTVFEMRLPALQVSPLRDSRSSTEV